MNTRERRRLAEAAVLPRLVALLGDERTVNGTRLAHAVATIAGLEIDGTSSPRLPAEERAARTDDATLVRIANAVREMIASGYGSGRTLPSGTQLKSHSQGSVKYGGSVKNGREVGGRQYSLSRARDGMFLDEGMPDDSQVVLAFRRDLLQAVAPVRATDVPPLTLDDLVVRKQGTWNNTVTLPVRSRAGVTVPITLVTRRRIDLMTDAEWQACLDDHAEREAAVAAKADRTDPKTLVFETIARDLVDKARREGIDVEFLGIQVHPNGRSGNGGTWRAALLRILDNGLKPAEWTVGTDGKGQAAQDAFAASIANQIGVQRRRQRRLEAALSQGASGNVDTITLAALRSADAAAEDVLKEVVRKGKALIDLPDNGRMRLSWRDGVVHSSFYLAPQIRWTYGILEIKNQKFPETVLQSIVGRPIGEVVEHEFMDARATVRSIGKSGPNWTKLNVAIASVPFDRETGAAIEDRKAA